MNAATNTTLLDHTLDDHLTRLLAAVTPDRVRDNGASITLTTGPGTTRDHDVTRQIRHLYDLGLVQRDGAGWSRTAAGDTYLAEQGGAQ